jgi:hypothetical protein
VISPSDVRPRSGIRPGCNQLTDTRLSLIGLLPSAPPGRADSCPHGSDSCGRPGSANLAGGCGTGVCPPGSSTACSALGAAALHLLLSVPGAMEQRSELHRKPAARNSWRGSQSLGAYQLHHALHGARPCRSSRPRSAGLLAVAPEPMDQFWGADQYSVDTRNVAGHGRLARTFLNICNMPARRFPAIRSLQEVITRHQW